MPKSSIASRTPRRFNCCSTATARSGLCMTVLSVISSSSRRGSSPVSRKTRMMPSQSSSRANWRADRLTATLTGGMPLTTQPCASAHAVRSTHSPIGAINPVSSAIGDEVARLHEAQLRMLPAYQRFDAGNEAAAHIDLRLVMQQEFAALDRSPQARLERQPLERMQVQSARSRTGGCFSPVPWRGTSRCRRFSAASADRGRLRDKC